jgi:deazaflavin-dependent oxidoreductase (nitroreductase family)
VVGGHGFLETGGQARPGMNDLLLTTRGRKSGTLRRTALVYGRDGDRFVLAASNGGASNHPAWCLNLLDDSEVTVQVGTETFAARARTATAEEKPPLWLLMVSIRPRAWRYQYAASSKASRLAASFAAWPHAAIAARRLG